MGASEPRWDAVVYGGGPAGSTVARLMAEWGYSVLLVTKDPGKQPGLAETLPPSCNRLFRLLGIHDRIEAAGFFHTTGNTSWWGGSSAHVERYSGGSGYQVMRPEFDAL